MEGTDEDATALAADINRIIKQTENDPSLNKSLVESRVNSFRSNLSMLNSSQQEDTPQALAERILEQEHIILPESVRLFCEGAIEVNGRKVTIKERKE